MFLPDRPDKICKGIPSWVPLGRSPIAIVDFACGRQASPGNLASPSDGPFGVLWQNQLIGKKEVEGAPRSAGHLLDRQADALSLTQRTGSKMLQLSAARTALNNLKSLQKNSLKMQQNAQYYAPTS